MKKYYEIQQENSNGNFETVSEEPIFAEDANAAFDLFNDSTEHPIDRDFLANEDLDEDYLTVYTNGENYVLDTDDVEDKDSYWKLKFNLKQIEPYYLTNEQLVAIIQTFDTWDDDNAVIHEFLSRVDLYIDFTFDSQEVVDQKIYDTLGLPRTSGEGIDRVIDLVADILGVDIYGYTDAQKEAAADQSAPFTDVVETRVLANRDLQKTIDSINKREFDDIRKLTQFTAAINKWFYGKVDVYVGDDLGQALYRRAIANVDIVRIAKEEIKRREQNKKEE